MQQKAERNFAYVQPCDGIFNKTMIADGKAEFLKPFYSAIKASLPTMWCEVPITEAESAEDAAEEVIKYLLNLAARLPVRQGDARLLLSSMMSKLNHDTQQVCLTFRCVPYHYDGEALRYVQCDNDGVHEVVELKHTPLSKEPIQVLFYNANVCNLGAEYESSSVFTSRLLSAWSQHKDAFDKRLNKLHDFAVDLERALTLTQDENKLAALAAIIGADPLTTKVPHEGKEVTLAEYPGSGQPLAVYKHLVFEYIVYNRLDSK